MPTDQIRRFPSVTAFQARDLGSAATSRPIGFLDDENAFVVEGDDGNVRRLSHAGQVVRCQEVTFTETAGAGVYTGSVSLAAGATIIDVIVHAVALWDNAGAVTMKVGDAVDDDGIFTAIDMKATDLLAAESISISKAGGKEGADVVATHFNRRYLATARVISGIITAASTGGSTGRTRMTVIWSEPISADAIAATKV